MVLGSWSSASNLTALTSTIANVVVPAGTNKKLLVFAVNHAGASTTDVFATSAQFGTSQDGYQNLTKVEDIIRPGGSGSTQRVVGELFALNLADTTPTGDVLVTWPSSVRRTVHAFVVGGLDQNASPVVSANDSIATISGTINSLTVGVQVFTCTFNQAGGVGTADLTLTPDAATTAIQNTRSGVGTTTECSVLTSEMTADATSETVTHTAPTTANRAAILLFAYPVAGGGGPSQEQDPTNVQVGSIQARSATATWQNGGTSTSYQYALTSPTSPDYSNPQALGNVLTTNLTFLGSRSHRFAIRAAGPLAPSNWVNFDFVAPDPVINPGQSDSLSSAEMATLKIDADPSSLGSAGVVQVRFVNTSDANVGENVTVDVIDSGDPLPPTGIFVNGQARTPTLIQTITTPTGIWDVYHLGACNSGQAYSWSLRSNPSWKCAMVGDTRPPPATHNPVDMESLNVIRIDGTDFTIRCCYGAIKWAENFQPIAPLASRITDAVAARKCAKMTNAAFNNIQFQSALSYTSGDALQSASLVALGYVPDRLYGRHSGGANVCGQVDHTGGEYAASRGYFHATDAALIACAVDNQPAAFSTIAERLKAMTYYAPTMPAGCIWSGINHCVRDPAFPLPGDLTIFTEGTANENWSSDPDWVCPPDYPAQYMVDMGAWVVNITNITKDVSGVNPLVISYDLLPGVGHPSNTAQVSIFGVGGTTELNGNTYFVRNINTTARTFNISTSISGSLLIGSTYGNYTSGGTARYTGSHSRDQAHLMNLGIGYWFSTYDPRIAIVIQALAQFCIGGNYLRYATTYRPRFIYQRTSMNYWSAMHKLSVVMQDITLANPDVILWSNVRATKMIDDNLNNWEALIAEMDAGTADDQVANRILRGPDQSTSFSNFMLQNYGTIPAYLWAARGRPKMLERLAQHFIIRLGDCGGYVGIDSGTSNSSVSIFSNGVFPAAPYDYQNGPNHIEKLVNWWISITPDSVNPGHGGLVNYNRAGEHTILMAHKTLVFAQDAVNRGWLNSSNVPGLAAALAKSQTAINATTSAKDVNAITWKHAIEVFD